MKERKSFIKFSRAISRLNVESNANVSKTSSIYIFRVSWSFLKLILKMEIELVYEMLAFNSTSMRLIARENFVTFVRRESIKSCKERVCSQQGVSMSFNKTSRHTNSNKSLTV
jgi:hypothetical protein